MGYYNVVKFNNYNKTLRITKYTITRVFNNSKTCELKYAEGTAIMDVVHVLSEIKHGNMCISNIGRLKRSIVKIIGE